MSKEDFEETLEKKAMLITHMRKLEYQVVAGEFTCGVENCNKKVAVIVGGLDRDYAGIHYLCWEHWEHFDERENDFLKGLEIGFKIQFRRK